jgi:erythromycin esterase
MAISLRFKMLAFCALLANVTYAQQPLVLDFEKQSVEGIARPWGWAQTSFAANTSFVLDSLTQHSGKYSLRMQGKIGNDTSQMQTLAYWICPIMLKNKKIQVKGWIKTENIVGRADIELATYGKDDFSLVKNIGNPITGTGDWQLYSADLEVNEKVYSIYINLNLKGSGTVWFDDLSFWVEGKEVKAVPLSKEFNKKEIAWLDRNTAVLSSFQPTFISKNANTDDLKSFKKIAGSAKLIALGESTHGTSEFFSMKHRLLEYAVKEMGVSVFGIEDHQVASEVINQYVLHGIGSAEKAIKGLFGVWNRQEVLELIRWMRAYNSQNPKQKVEFVGFDMQSPISSIDSLLSFIARQKPSLSSQIQGLVSDFAKNAPNIYIANDSAKIQWYKNANKIWEILDKEQNNWLLEAKNAQDSLRIWQGVQYANLVRQSAGQYAGGSQIGQNSYFRDSVMAVNIQWHFSVRKPNTKMLIWAHDFHISRGDDSDDYNNPFFGVSMGAFLSKKYGNDYRTFALFTHTGTYKAMVSYMNYKLIDAPLFPAPKGSFEEALHQISAQKDKPILLLDLQKARKEASFSMPRPLRFANHVSMDFGFEAQYSIPFQYDAVIFIDKTKGAEEIRR